MRITDGARVNRYLRVIIVLVESGILLSVVLGLYAAMWFASFVRPFHLDRS